MKPNEIGNFFTLEKQKKKNWKKKLQFESSLEQEMAWKWDNPLMW